MNRLRKVVEKSLLSNFYVHFCWEILTRVEIMFSSVIFLYIIYNSNKFRNISRSIQTLKAKCKTVNRNRMKEKKVK